MRRCVYDCKHAREWTQRLPSPFCCFTGDLQEAYTIEEADKVEKGKGWFASYWKIFKW